MDRLKQEIDQLIADVPGKHSVYLKDIETGEVLAMAADEKMAAASLIKVPILYVLYDLAARGEIDLDETLKPAGDNTVGGAGVLSWFKARPELTLMDLAELMIVISDNTATNILIDKIGFEPVNNYLKENELKLTCLERKMMDTEARRAGRENITTAREMGQMMELAYLNESLSGARATLCRQQLRDKISYLIPENLWSSVASKTGMLKGIEHDASLFLEPEPFVAVIMSSELESQAAGKLLQAKIGKKIYQYLKMKGG